MTDEEARDAIEVALDAPHAAQWRAARQRGDDTELTRLAFELLLRPRGDGTSLLDGLRQDLGERGHAQFKRAVVEMVATLEASRRGLMAARGRS